MTHNLIMPEVGRSIPRTDALPKAAGVELFAADHYPEDVLWAGVKRAGIPHAQILDLDVSKAAALPGVLRVLTAGDIRGSNRQGIVHKDQPVLCKKLVRYVGDPLALVIARDKDTLKNALSLIKADFNPLPGVFDVKSAMKRGAPLVHAGRKEGNILLKAEISTGSAKKAFAECDVIVRGVFETPVQEHAFLEPQNGVAWSDASGSIEMIVSTQSPFRDRFEIAHALGLDFARIRIRAPYLGGGFGGKDGATVQCLLALAAMHAEGRAVKMFWEREESILAGYKRHRARMEYTLGAKSDGTLHALSCKLYYDTGAYAHLGGEIMELGMEHAGGPYRIPNTDIRGWCVYTNNPVAGAFRGFGVAQVSLAFERMIDRVAGRLKLDPLAVRRKNALKRGDRNTSGVTLTTSTGIADCLKVVSGHGFWRDREKWRKSAGRFKARGVGVSAVFNAMGYGRGLLDGAIAKVEFKKDGGFRIYNSVTDMGQGNAHAFVQIAGEILRQDADRLEIVQPDTALCLPSGSSSAGRTTYAYGNALVKACEKMAKALFHRAAMLLLIDEADGFVLLPGLIRHLPTGKEVRLDFLAKLVAEHDRVCSEQFSMPVSREVPDTGKDFLIGFPHLFFSYAAHLARIEVDTLTGVMRVCDYLAVTDGGRVINPQCFEQQVQGGVAQGLGYAAFEELILENGIIANPNLATYLIPTAMDVPDIASIPVETVEHTGPFGMKGIGEVGLNGPLPALAQALEHALGIRPVAAPFTPERILAAIQAKKRAK